jgi:hypothetical protein
MLEEPRETQWYEAAVRPIVAADDGLLVVGRTRSHWFVGQVTAAGATINPLPTTGDSLPLETTTVIVYTLLDLPVRLR